MKNINELVLSFFLLATFVNATLYSNLVSDVKQLARWAEKLPKSILVKEFSEISLRELKKYLTKVERIDFLLEKAYVEGRLMLAYIYKLRTIYSKIPYGDKFLYLCLKDKSCNPLNFATKANSWLYQQIIRRYPNISSKKELEKISGYFSERFTVKIFEKSGWKCINGKYHGENGFDGLCIKTNWFGKIKDVLILESKAEDSILGYAKCGKQMSKACVVSILEVLRQNYDREKNWFQKLLGKNEYQEILELVKEGKYRRRLVRVRSTQYGLRIEISKIEDNGSMDIKKIKENIIDVNLVEPLTKQDKYFKSIAEEALEEALENVT